MPMQRTEEARAPAASTAPESHTGKGNMSSPFSSGSPRYHVIRRRVPRRSPDLGPLVYHTCSARCCLEILNLFSVAPGEHVYTGGGEWNEWIWGYTDEPQFPDYRVHCEFCGTVLHDPFDPNESLFSRRSLWRPGE